MSRWSSFKYGFYIGVIQFLMETSVKCIVFHPVSTCWSAQPVPWRPAHNADCQAEKSMESASPRASWGGARRCQYTSLRLFMHWSESKLTKLSVFSWVFFLFFNRMHTGILQTDLANRSQRAMDPMRCRDLPFSVVSAVFFDGETIKMAGVLVENQGKQTEMDGLYMVYNGKS